MKITTMSATKTGTFLGTFSFVSYGHLWSVETVIPQKTEQGVTPITHSTKLRTKRFGVRIPKGVPFLALINRAFFIFRALDQKLRDFFRDFFFYWRGINSGFLRG